MKIDVKIAPDKAESFLLYLLAELKKISNSPFPCHEGSAWYQDDGSYVTSLTGQLISNDIDCSVTLTVPQLLDGSIPFIELIFIDCPDTRRAEIIAHEFVLKVLTETLSVRKEKFLVRNIFVHPGPMLDGEYWLPGFRIAPAIPDDPKPYLVNAERFVYIDQEISAIDNDHAHTIGSYQADTYAARLSLLTNIGFSRPQGPELVWVLIDKEGGGYCAKRLHRGIIPEFIEKMPKKGELCKIGEYGESLTNLKPYQVELLRIPLETRHVFRGLSNSPKNQRAFDGCARLFQLALTAGRYSQSLRFAYKVAAVDAIAKNTDYKHFKKFMRSQLSDLDGIDDFLDYLHGPIRSAHFHGGEIPLDYPSWNFSLFDRQSYNRHYFQMEANTLIWKAISSWILKEVAIMT